MARGSNVSKSDLAAELASAHELSKSQATAIIASLVESITNHVSRGRKVVISGFANFEVKARKARMGRNPQTGESIRIPAKKALKIRPLKAFKDAVA